MRAAESTAPYRADLAGGTLDIWPLGVLIPGALTVNAALPLEVRVLVDDAAPQGEVWHAVGGAAWRRLEGDDLRDLTVAVIASLRPARGVRVRVAEQAPVGSGLGGSSSYAVALARGVLGLAGRSMPDEELVAVLRDLEARVLGAPTGSQDHWAAVRGGVLALHLEPGRPRVEALPVPLPWMAERLTVVYSGVAHSSGMVNWQVIRRRLDGEPGTVAALEEIAAAAARCREALLELDSRAVGAAVAAEWTARRRLAPEVCPPALARLTDAVLDGGADAVKACGAGGGGSFLVWHRPGHRETLEAVLRRAGSGARVLAHGVSASGAAVRTL